MNKTMRKESWKSCGRKYNSRLLVFLMQFFRLLQVLQIYNHHLNSQLFLTNQVHILSFFLLYGFFPDMLKQKFVWKPVSG